MKLNLSRFTLCAFVCAIAAQVLDFRTVNATKSQIININVEQITPENYPHLSQSQRQIFALLLNFMNPAVDPQKPFSVFADEAIGIINSDAEKAKYTSVCAKLRDLVKRMKTDKSLRNPIKFQKEFVAFAHLFPETLKKELEDVFVQIEKSKQVPALLEIMKKRLAK